MSTLEDRLRDAYRGAGDTVRPEAIRGLEERIRQRSAPARPPARRRRALAPAAAALAVTGLAVLAAALPPVLDARPDSPGPPPASSAAPKFMIADDYGASLQVHNAATGALVATINLPSAPGQVGATVGPVATGDNRTLWVAVTQLQPCESWLYRVHLDDAGRPVTVTPFDWSAIGHVSIPLDGLAVSADGRRLGYLTAPCNSSGQPYRLTLMDIATGQTRQWTVPDSQSVGAFSLNANGSLLSYTLQVNAYPPPDPSVVRVMPADAPPGNLAARGTTVAESSHFGPKAWIPFCAIAPDGRAVYFTIYPNEYPPKRGTFGGQIRVLDLATGRSRLVAAAAGQPVQVTADPSVQHLLLQTQATYNSPVELAKLDLASGRFARLPSAWLGPEGGDITW